jgi:hypothetical protein
VRGVNSCLAKEGLSKQWLTDRVPDLDLGEAAVPEFSFWHRLANIHLNPDREVAPVWRWMRDGLYSSKSAYVAFFSRHDGHLDPRADLEVQGALHSCKFFAWMASQNPR